MRFFTSNAAITNVMSAEGQLKLPGQGSSAGLLIGGDTLLYRESADAFRMADQLTVDLDIITVQKFKSFTAGTSGAAGGVGGAGFIVVEEYY